MSTDSSSPQLDPWVKKVALLKEMAVNPSMRIPDAGREVGVSRATAYDYMKEFAKVYRAVETDDDSFIEKVVRYYNKRVPQDLEEDQYLTDKDVISLRQIAYKLLPGDETLISAEEPNNSTLSSTNVPDLSSNAAILKTLLENTRNTQPVHIKKFLEVFNIMEPQWMANPIQLFEYLKYMFGPAAGENIFNAFNSARGAHVYTPSQGFGGMGMPNMMMGGLGGGMMPGMGNPNDPMYQAMVQKELYDEMKAEKEKRREDERFDKIMRIMMMKMMGTSMNDKMPMNPFDPNNPVPFQVNEVMDETGAKVKQRTITPNFGGMGGQSELMTMILKNSMDQNNMLMAKSMDSSKPITDLFMAMFPHFRANSNPIELVGQLKQAFPEVFNKEQGGLSNSIDALRLKFDTEMAMQAQKMQLFEKQHGWEMEKLDKQEAGKNAEGWMSMLGQLGEKLAAPVASVVLGQFGGGMAAKQGQQQQLTPEQMKAQMLAQEQARQAREAAEKEANEQAGQFAPTIGNAMQQPDQKDFAIEYLKMQNQQLQNALQMNQQPMKPVAAVARQTPSVDKELNFENLNNLSLQELESMQAEITSDMNNTTKWNSAIEATIAEKRLAGDTTGSIDNPYDHEPPALDEDDDDNLSLSGANETQPVSASAMKKLEDED